MHNLIKPAKKAGFFVYINYLLEKTIKLWQKDKN